MKQMKQMKLMYIALLAMVMMCGKAVAANRVAVKNTTVEVVVFHGVKQCQTCQAIKKNAQEVATEVAKTLGVGKKVVYKVVDFSKPENKKLAEKYQIAWTSLLLIKHGADGKETIKNLSEYAIENARTNTEAFRKTLSEDIRTLLKN